MTASLADVLVVEDDPNDVALFGQALARRAPRPNALFVSDGVEALDYLLCRNGHFGRDRAIQPQLVMLDLKLSGIDGFEVLRHMRATPMLVGTAVVVLSSSAEPPDIASSYAAGANSYLVKPAKASGFLDLLDITFRYWLGCNIDCWRLDHGR